MQTQGAIRMPVAGQMRLAEILGLSFKSVTDDRSVPAIAAINPMAATITVMGDP
jgi:hypothetical protein